MSTLLVTLMSSSVAHALGGSFVGVRGEVPPTSTGTQVVAASRGGTTTLTLTAQAGEDAAGIAYLWPAAGLVQGSLIQPEPDGILGLEAFTRPRVESLECNELVDTLRYRTPPGCASYEVELVVPPARGEDAVGQVPLEIDFASVEVSAVVLTSAQVGPWLDELGYALAAPVAQRYDRYFDAQVPFVAVYVEELVPRGSWIPPIRFQVQSAEVDLALAGPNQEARTEHDLTIYTIHDDATTDAEILGLEEVEITGDCQVPATIDPADLLEEDIDRLRGRAVPAWVTLYAGTSGACAPCTSDLLEPIVTADLGVPGLDLPTGRVSRLTMRTQPRQLDIDPTLAFTAEAQDQQLRWLTPREGLGWAFPVCGEEPDPSDTCPQVSPEPPSGCSATPGLSGASGLSGLAPLGGVVFVGLLLLRRRRRSRSALPLAAAVVAIGLAGLARPAHAIDDGFLDKRPTWSAVASWGLLGTDRVRLGVTDERAPRLLNPLVGGELRWSMIGFADGINLGLVAGLRGLRATLDRGDGTVATRFSLVEPSLGLDMRHGFPRRKAGISPFVRYGARIALPTIDPDVSQPQSVVTALVHVGGGIWVGNGARDRLLWPIVELQASVLPRTDGFVTDYHPSLERPSFTFFPGSAQIQLLAGVGFR